jgi:catechol 2,3-dioxygenase-like lactoylglutathione lyase family enzyme
MVLNPPDDTPLPDSHRHKRASRACAYRSAIEPREARVLATNRHRRSRPPHPPEAARPASVPAPWSQSRIPRLWRLGLDRSTCSCRGDAETGETSVRPGREQAARRRHQLSLLHRSSGASALRGLPSRCENGTVPTAAGHTLAAMSLHLFAGLRVRDFQMARSWYEQLLGEPTFFPHATEAVWTLADDRSVYVVEQANGAGHCVVTIFVDDLDAQLAAIATRGLEPDEWETYSNGVRKAVYRDPDGNELGFGGAPLDADS